MKEANMNNCLKLLLIIGLPVQLVEVKSGEILLLAMELFGGAYGKSTFFPLKIAN